jgi:hypothetical protein
MKAFYVLVKTHYKKLGILSNGIIIDKKPEKNKKNIKLSGAIPIALH